MFKKKQNVKKWQIVEQTYEPDKAQYHESIFTLGNGYLGTRGSLEEGDKYCLPATFIAGVYDEIPGQVSELVNVPNWLMSEFYINKIPFELDKGKILSHKRILDLKKGALVRETRLKDLKGRITKIKSIRFVSMNATHLMGIKYIITPENYSGKLKIETGIDGNVTNQGISHLNIIEKGKVGEKGVYLTSVTKYSKIIISETAIINIYSNKKSCKYKSKSKFSINTIKEKEKIKILIEFKANEKKEYVLEKIVSIFTSREVDIPQKRSISSAKNAIKVGFDGLFKAHKSEWGRLWRDSDIEIEGDIFAQKAVRLSIFHLLQAASKSDETVSIPAKLLSGFGYKGHIFWDTDIYMLPFFIYTNPKLAKNLLMYRYNTLNGAKKNAKNKGYDGAMFAWESSVTGEETTPRWAFNQVTGEKIPILTGEKEHHITIDVAYAVNNYYLFTKDIEFLLNYGAELIFETAKFWVSRLKYNEKKNQYEIIEVIGPDEYHEDVNNNAYTNIMAKWNIRKALEISNLLKSKYPKKWIQLKNKLKLNLKVLNKWESMLNRIYIPFDKKKNIFKQFDGFMKLSDINLEDYKEKTKKVESVWGREKIGKTKIIKQADVIMFLYLLKNEIDKKVKRANWDFYEPKTTHSSSLSTAIHSLVACDIGLLRDAYKYFLKSAEIDLEDSMHNTCDGLHGGAMGGLIQAVINGFAGLNIDGQGLSLNPNLPKNWKSLKFNLKWRGETKRIYIKNNKIFIS
jgi:trehalose/maltose hydrolase-like predicted phosphorylase